MTAQPPQVGRPREHTPPQQAVSPPPSIRPQIAPHGNLQGLPPGIRGPSPPQQGRPAPGTLGKFLLIFISIHLCSFSFPLT